VEYVWGRAAIGGIRSIRAKLPNKLLRGTITREQQTAESFKEQTSGKTYSKTQAVTSEANIQATDVTAVSSQGKS